MAAPATTATDVKRLFGRVCFGATPAEHDTWVGRPYGEMVDAVIGASSDLYGMAAHEVSKGAARYADVLAAQRWWMEQMRTTKQPFRERMTLLWHNHFATAVSPEFANPNVPSLMQQNETLRALALGRIEDLVNAMTVDEAMLHWLNGAQSAPPKPNENYAREFFELFTLGKSPQAYSETDIREASRAFTGWRPNGKTGTFQASRHDHGVKTILGVKVPDLGAEEYKRVAHIALAQAVSPRFIAWKLVSGLAYSPPPADLLRQPDPLVRRVADTLVATSGDITAAVRTLLLSDEFRFGDADRQLVRQPVDVTIAACKALRVNAGDNLVVDVAGRMGQRVFQPPNVGGWPVETTWISPATTIAHYDLGLVVMSKWGSQSAPIRAAIPAADDLGGWIRLFGLDQLSTSTTQAIRRYLASRPTSELERQYAVATLLLASPDWLVI